MLDRSPRTVSEAVPPRLPGSSVGASTLWSTSRTGFGGASSGAPTARLADDGVEPILVGGGALEVYAAGGYAAGILDLDLVFEAPAASGLPGEAAPRSVLDVDGLRPFFPGSIRANVGGVRWPNVMNVRDINEHLLRGRLLLGRDLPRWGVRVPAVALRCVYSRQRSASSGRPHAS